MWQDVRTEQLVRELERKPGAERIRQLCGLPLATYFSAPRLRWLLDTVPGLRERPEQGDVLFGTMETWLLWNLTGGTDGGVHVTDVTNASRTLLMNLAGADAPEAGADLGQRGRWSHGASAVADG